MILCVKLLSLLLPSLDEWALDLKRIRLLSSDSWQEKHRRPSASLLSPPPFLIKDFFCAAAATCMGRGKAKTLSLQGCISTPYNSEFHEIISAVIRSSPLIEFYLKWILYCRYSFVLSLSVCSCAKLFWPNSFENKISLNRPLNPAGLWRVGGRSLGI